MILRLVFFLLAVFTPLLAIGGELVFPADLPMRNKAWNYHRARELLRTTDYRDVPLTLVTRAQWKARKITEPYEPIGEIKGIVIHQSETPETTTLRSIQEYHQTVKKWADIGYHFVIAQFPNAKGKLEWRVFEARPLSAKGAHAGRMDGVDLNPGQIGICLMGDFDQPGTHKHRDAFGRAVWDGENFPPANFSSSEPEAFAPELKPYFELQADPRAVYLLGQLVEKLYGTYGSQIKEILGHGAGDHAIFPGHKSCPGEGSYHLVEALRSRYGMDNVDRTR